MFSKKMEKALNEQINYEFFSEYYYLSMSAWFNANDLPGMSAFMMRKSGEERVHAMRLFKFVQDRDGAVELLAIEKPKTSFSGHLEIFETALHHEQEVTRRIHKLFELAQSESDYATQIEIQWFITEQVEEEKQAKDIIRQVKLVGDNSTALFMLDEKLGSMAVLPAEAE